MLKESLKVASILLIFVAVYPQLGFFQESMNFSLEDFGSTIGNLIDLASAGLNFIENDFAAGVEDELHEMTPKDKAVYDFIVIGAGSAGAVVASRLSELKNVTVLLIEAGIAENAAVDIPLLAMYLQLNRRFNWGYKMERSTNYCRAIRDNQCRMPRGKIMGGCSILNLMIATRGNHRDYDTWAKMGCEGWSWKDVFPLFKRMENFDVKDPSVEKEYHSSGGLLNIARAPFHTNCSSAFVKAGLERGFPLVDYDGEEQIGYSYSHATIKNGARFSSNRAYLYPAKGRPNLFLTRESFARKILISETKRAFGVLFTKNKKNIRAMAKREVIVCAGAINSPKLLMLSGIGPSNHLEKMRIQVKKDAPVGENLMDHMTYWGLNFLVNESVTVETASLFDRPIDTVSDYLMRHDGPLTITGGIEALAFIDVDNLKARKGSPNMELIFTGISVASDPLVHESLSLKNEYYNTCFSNMLNKRSFMILPTLLSPKSRGRVLLRSRNPADAPIINPNYFDDPEDMRRLILGIREAIRVSETPSMQRFGAKLSDNPIPGCESFKKDSDGFWDCAARTFGNTLYHPSGTCKMGARNDSTAVVDPRLRVIGINGLRVADASIMPTIILGHTNVPSMMIGEKLAEMVKEDWGFVKRE